MWWSEKLTITHVNKLINIFKISLKKNKEATALVMIINELFNKNVYNTKELSKIIDKYLIPHEHEKNINAEVSTPFSLRQEMLDKIPSEFWRQPRKVFEPCCGKAGFNIDIIDRFMIGLVYYEPNEQKRYKIILEECLHWSDINKTNILIGSLLLDPYKQYKLNYNLGSTLTLDINRKWSLDGFDAIIGNPPYQSQVGPRKTQAIWNVFVKWSINNLLNNGLLLFVHPSGWRSPDGMYRDVYEKIMENKLMYLNMNGFKRGQEIFHCGTNFDYYLLRKHKSTSDDETLVNDIDNKEYKIKLKEWPFIPSGGFKMFKKLLCSNKTNKVSVLYSRSAYGTDKENMNITKDDKFKYPCCYTITMRDGIKLYHSSKKKEHFKIPKVIWSNGLGTYPVIDKTGKYGLTQFSYAIVDRPENLEKIEVAMNNPKFISLMKYVKFTDNKYNYKVIGLLKVDFYNDFQ